MGQTQSLTVGGRLVRVEAFHLDSDEDVSLNAARPILSDDETARARRFVYDLHRDRFVRGRAYLRLRLSDQLGCAPADVPLVQGVHGKPELAARSLAFNLSNSGGRAVLAVATEGMVGVDLECVARAGGFEQDLAGLARSCMTPEEQTVLSDLPDELRPRRFLEFWTAKEARMKLTGEGMYLDPRAISVTLRDGRPAGIGVPDEPTCVLEFVNLCWSDAICCVATCDNFTAATPPRSERSHAWTA